MRITVVGRHRVERAPEVGRLRLLASHSGADAAQVYDETVAVVAAVAARLEALDGALETWSVDPVSTSSWEPRDDTGRPLPREHTAQTTITADFRDVEALSAFAAEHGSLAGLSQEGVEWRLTDETQRLLEDEAATGAVIAASERAQVIARASGAGRVRCLAVADPGLLGAGGAEPAGDGREVAMLAKGFGMARTAHDEVDPRPQSIAVVAEVHATFEADATPG